MDRRLNGSYVAPEQDLDRFIALFPAALQGDITAIVRDHPNAQIQLNFKDGVLLHVSLGWQWRREASGT